MKYIYIYVCVRLLPNNVSLHKSFIVIKMYMLHANQPFMPWANLSDTMKLGEETCERILILSSEE